MYNTAFFKYNKENINYLMNHVGKTDDNLEKKARFLLLVCI